MEKFIIGSMRKCPICGKMYKVKAYNQVYCSVNCRLVAAEERRLKKIAGNKPRYCPVCGKSFKPTLPDQVYCSRRCYGRRISGEKRKARGIAKGCTGVECSIRIIKEPDVFPELRPKVGSVLPALWCKSEWTLDFALVEIGGKTIVIRHDEFVRLT